MRVEECGKAGRRGTTSGSSPALSIVYRPAGVCVALKQSFSEVPLQQDATIGVCVGESGRVVLGCAERSSQ